MTTVITFPISGIPDIFTFDRASAGESFALGLGAGTASFVLGRVTKKSLAVLTSRQLISIYNAAHPDEEPIKKLSGSKRQLVERVLPLITSLARPGKAPSTKQETGTMATKKKATKKAAPAKKATAAKKKAAPAKKGRTPSFTGMKLYKTDKGAKAKRNEGSRRSISFAAITNGMRYETALEKGAVAADIVIMERMGHIEARAK